MFYLTLTLEVQNREYKLLFHGFSFFKTSPTLFYSSGVSALRAGYSLDASYDSVGRCYILTVDTT